MLAGGPISWKSKKQTCVVLSSNEAEFIAASETARQAVWLEKAVFDFGIGGLKNAMRYIFFCSQDKDRTRQKTS